MGMAVNRNWEPALSRRVFRSVLSLSKDLDLILLTFTPCRAL